MQIPQFSPLPYIGPLSATVAMPPGPVGSLFPPHAPRESWPAP